jgi:glycosyltransferase involved in cell wall biosynthesis
MPNKNILYVGTLIRNRHLDFIILVFAKVLERVPGVRLQFVGKGSSPEDEELLREEIAKQDIDPDTVEFVGYVPIDRVWQYIEQAAVCLSPYYPSFELTSTSPTKLIEYMAMARPIVANEHPEQSIVISQSKCGFCVPWEETAFADAIVALLEDSAAANEMGRSGRQWVVRNRTNAFMADLVEGQYLKCLQSSDSRGGRNVTEDAR